MDKKYDLNDKKNVPETKELEASVTCLLCNLVYIKFNTNLNLGFPICQNCWEFNKNQFKYYKDKRTNFFPEIDEITEKVYLGNEDAQRDKENLKKLGITHILVIGTFLDIFHPLDFVYKILPVENSPSEDITKYFEETYDFIEKNEKIFVHCQLGISRSASIVLAYLMRKNKMVYEEAFQFVKLKRSVINPNSGFINQLKHFKFS